MTARMTTYFTHSMAQNDCLKYIQRKRRPVYLHFLRHLELDIVEVKY